MYQGHNPDGSSMQNHSTGAAYPYIMAVRGEQVEVWAPGGEVLHTIALGHNKASRLNAYRRGASLAVAYGKAYHAARANR